MFNAEKSEGARIEFEVEPRQTRERESNDIKSILVEQTSALSIATGYSLAEFVCHLPSSHQHVHISFDWLLCCQWGILSTIHFDYQ